MKNTLTLDSLQNLFTNGFVEEVENGHLISRPHQRVLFFCWLLEGSLQYYSEIDHVGTEVLVSEVDEPFMPIGWGGLNPPYRFGLKIKVASAKAKLFFVHIEEAKATLFDRENKHLIKKICSALYHQLGANLSLQQDKLSPLSIKEHTDFENYFISPESTIEEVIALFNRSPFLSHFSTNEIERIALAAERRDYERGEVVVEQDEHVSGLSVMVQGEVAIRRIKDDSQVNLRSISSPGFLFGWSCLLEEIELCEAITTTKTSIYFISQKQLFEIFKNDEEFSSRFYQRLIWLVGNQLNVAFTRYLNLKLNHDILATQNLIHSSKSRLFLSSEMHQVPHLLASNETKNSAFDILHRLNKSGNALERHLASTALDLLRKEEKEGHFLDGLKAIYQSVAEADERTPPAIIRKSCTQETQKLFKKLSFSIEGKENLPTTPGHIFIYNHLLNPPEYTLGNNFQITLDSHFVSSLILAPQYDEPGIRTVRIGKGQEYGHQDYYEKLGYINVYTKDSENVNTKIKEEARSIFFRDANDFLNKKFNLIISPEGTSYSSEESPGPFKTGAFRLAMNREKPTLIVPIVLKNFDKRINENHFYCKILKPIDLQKEIKDKSEVELKSFIVDLEEIYRAQIATFDEQGD